MDPTGIAASKKTPGRFYIADKNNHRIRTMDVAANGTVTIGTYAGDGTPGYLEGPRLSARFFRPYAIAVGDDETLYVTDLGNHKLRKIAPDGTVSFIAGSVKGHADGQGAAAAFDIPAGLARAADGTLYVLDQGTSVLRAVTPDGTVSTLAGLSANTGRVDGQGDVARFYNPIGLTLGPDGNLYVADLNVRSIRKVTPGGLVSTVVGSNVLAKSHLDGDPLAGGISYPYSLCFGPDGTLYIGSYNVRFLTPDGKLKTYAGETYNGYKDGTNDASLFENIYGMTMTPEGVLYVIEGQRVRAVVPPTTP
jgi:DNA-binding beta-propeller fold protein YncE